jgi:hypothetical protein
VSVIANILTGADGETHDIGRWSWAGSFLAIVALTTWKAWHGEAVSVTDLAEALGIVSGAHCVGLMAKAKTEPQP